MEPKSKFRIFTFTNSHLASEFVAKIIAEKIKKKPHLVLGLPTGNSPKELYQILTSLDLDWSNVITFNLDEYQELPLSRKESYHSYMDKFLFNRINIKKENTFFPLSRHNRFLGQGYDLLIKEKGAIDLQILGVGVNGHIGFNEPGTSFDSLTHVTKLELSTRIANKEDFSSLEAVPHSAVTAGIQTIMAAKEIILLAFGKKKSEIVYRFLTSTLDEKIPATVLKQHSNFTLILDEEAGKKFFSIGVWKNQKER